MAWGKGVCCPAFLHIAEEKNMPEERNTPEDMTSALRRLLDENAILDVMARFDDAIIRRDVETFRTLWVEDGIWEIGQFNPAHVQDVQPLHAQGIEQLVAALELFNRMNEFFFRTTLRGVITLDGDHAIVRSPTTEYARRHDGHGYNNVALYQDELVRRNGTWLFVARRYHYVWIDSVSPIAGNAVELPPL